MSTSSSDLTLEDALAGVPGAFRNRLIKAYKAVKQAHASGQHDSAGTRAGRFCEVSLRLLQDELTQSYIPFGTSIGNLEEECRKLGQTPKTAGPESLRIIIPRALVFLYTLRNKRGIGHEGGDVDANEIDSATCVRLADWCLCEFIRVYHSLSLEEAQAVLDAVAEREVPEVWTVAGKKRVLEPGMTYGDQVLRLLYSDPDTAVAVEDLVDWTDHPSAKDFRRQVLAPLHRKRFVEFDRDSQTVLLSPTGAAEAEDELVRKNAVT